MGFHSPAVPLQGKGLSGNDKNSTESINDQGTTTEAEAQLCTLLCAYSAIGGVIRCTLGSTSLIHCSTDHQGDNQSSMSTFRTNNSSSARQINSTFCYFPVLIDLCAVQDVILQLAASFAHTKINSHESLESYFLSNLTGAEVIGRIQHAESASVESERIASMLSVPVSALQHWLQHLIHVCDTTTFSVEVNPATCNSSNVMNSSCSTLPTSTKYGIIAYSASLVRVTASQATNIATSKSNTASMLSTVLSLYTLMGATDKEDALIVQEEKHCKLYRKYLKSIYHTYHPVKRRKAIRYGRNTRRKRNKHHYRKDSNVDGESVGSGSDDGAIESQSEDESEDEPEIVNKKIGDVSPVSSAVTFGAGFTSPTGFQLTSVLSEQQLRQVQKNRDLHISNMAVSRQEDVVHSGGAGHKTAFCVQFIIDHCSSRSARKAAADVYEDENEEPVKSSMVQLPLMCGYLCHLESRLQSEFSRWDMHIISTRSSASSSVHPPAAAQNLLSKEEAERLLSNYITPQSQLSALRDVLFDVRSELLLALTSILQSESVCELEDGFPLQEANQLCLLMAKELKQSMQSGLTLRVFNVSLNLILISFLLNEYF